MIKYICGGALIMKLLKVIASGYKNCTEHFSIDFLARSKKTEEDKEYELLEIADQLYVFSTMAVIGKNASGKTSAIELLDCCYDILSKFRLEYLDFEFDGVKLEMYFYEEGYVYYYSTKLRKSAADEKKSIFTEQYLFRKKYFKSKTKEIFSEKGWERLVIDGELPEDISIVFFVLKTMKVREIYYGVQEDKDSGITKGFSMIKKLHFSDEVIKSILKIFDDKVDDLIQLDENKYLLIYQGQKKELTEKELEGILSSGTIKGLSLYLTAYASLKYGFDLLIDEIENHFHKSLVNNLLCLYKDKSVNKHNASLVFTTHYCEILDMFNRSDNIWITKSQDKVIAENMYEKYGLRSELSKSKKFYENAFGTGVDYEALMNLKELLMK